MSQLSERPSEHFTWAEVTRSPESKRWNLPNDLDTHGPFKAREILRRKRVQASIIALLTYVIEPARHAFGPIRANSVYRSPVEYWRRHPDGKWKLPRLVSVNSVVGGVASSQHTLGEAADIEPLGGDKDIQWLLFEFLANPANGIPFDQLIWEYDEWVHVSHGPRHRREIRVKRAGENRLLTWEQIRDGKWKP